MITLSAALFCGCTDRELKKAIKVYRGDGQIQYLEAPMLGVSGCAIQMPTLDLSQPVHVQYDFTGIPPGIGKYVIYLVVPEPCPLEAILQGVYYLRVWKNNVEVRNLKSIVKNITNSQGGHDNRFYFYTYNSDQGLSAIDVQDSTSKWSIAVSYTNAVLKEPVEAYILIIRGGCK
jgi:hypothetical protein